MIDVCLIVEHSYPHRTGGVSEAVDDLVRSLPDVSFSVLHLHDTDAPPTTRAYATPPNVVRVVTAPADSSAADAVPEARVVHAMCVGDASDAAADAARERGVAYVLTEHGLALHEVGLGIVGCNPFRHRPRPTPELLARLGAQARRAYEAADAVTTVCRHNARRQAAWGQPGLRPVVIPNTVPYPGPAPASTGPLRVGFVGRVVPVKDLATFLRACRMVADVTDAATFHVVGPLDHDPAYAERCRTLVSELDLDRHVRFSGALGRRAWPEVLDVVVLTSVSEAQPLALLEAMAAGRPVVAPAVGGCPELVGGRDPAGLLTRARDPRGTARAVVRLVCDPLLRERLGQAGRRRVAADHRAELMAHRYRGLYERLLDRRPWAA